MRTLFNFLFPNAVKPQSWEELNHRGTEDTEKIGLVFLCVLGASVVQLFLFTPRNPPHVA
jgi:hypothetical protein